MPFPMPFPMPRWPRAITTDRGVRSALAAGATGPEDYRHAGSAAVGWLAGRPFVGRLATVLSLLVTGLLLLPTIRAETDTTVPQGTGAGLTADAGELEEDGVGQRNDIGERALDLLMREQFAELNRWVDDSRQQNRVLACGTRELHWIFLGLDPGWHPSGTRRVTEDDVNKRLDKVRVWAASEHDSLNRRVAEAALLRTLARVNSSSFWRERADAALADLRDGDGRFSCPHMYYVGVTLAAQKGDFNRVAEEFHNLLEQDTGDQFMLRRVAWEVAVLNRRTFQATALEQWVDSLIRRHPDLAGSGALAHAICEASDATFLHAFFEAGKFEWPKLRESYAELLQHHPNSRFHWNRYARFASLMGDREAAAEAFARLDGQFDHLTWGHWSGHTIADPYSRWALEADGRHVQMQPVQQLELHQAHFENIAQAIAVAPDRDVVAVAFGVNKVALWSLETFELLDQLEIEEAANDFQLQSCAWSHDGTLLLVSSWGVPDNRRGPGYVHFIDCADENFIGYTRRELATLPFKIQFGGTRDDGQIVMSMLSPARGQPLPLFRFFRRDGDWQLQRMALSRGHIGHGIGTDHGGNHIAVAVSTSELLYARRSANGWGELGRRPLSGNDDLLPARVAMSVDGDWTYVGWSHAGPIGPGTLGKVDVLASGGEGEPVQLEHPGPMGVIDDVSTSPDGAMVAASSRDGWNRVWSTADGRLIRAWPGPEPGRAWSHELAWTRDSRLLIDRGNARGMASVRLWDPHSEPAADAAE